VFNKIILIFFLLSCPFHFFAQKRLEDGYKKFYFENGQISSEGIIKNGLPEGYWISYYPNGLMKSEGNRKNNLLDSTWIFYNKLGNIKSKIDYTAEKKNGLKVSYSDSCNVILEENFVNDIKQNYTTYYYDVKGRKKWKEINFIDNIREGNSFEYGLDNRIITLIYYKKGTLIGKEFINRYDKLNRKKGIWKSFYANGKLKEESRYKYDLLNGYLKEYDEKGKLINATLYINGVPQSFAAELASLDIRKEYYPNGNIKKEGIYDVIGKENGIFKYYDENGIIESAEIYLHGVLLARGIIDEMGKRQGYWEEYYKNGNIKSRGKYKDGKRIEEWEYYFVNKKLKQKGSFLEQEKATGLWVWYYENGNILRKEYFRKGLEDGMLNEYTKEGKIITEGEFIDGEKDGLWFYEMGDHIEKGNYLNGEKNGVWKYYYTNGKLNFEGNFIDGEPDGKHKFYYSNGKLKKEEIFVMGVKSETWKSYNEQGELVLSIYFKEGKEYKIDGTKLKH
jgi:antitoxin component YwqK of YwqJK toxin-antitoxin module